MDESFDTNFVETTTGSLPRSTYRSNYRGTNRRFDSPRQQPYRSGSQVQRFGKRTAKRRDVQTSATTSIPPKHGDEKNKVSTGIQMFLVRNIQIIFVGNAGIDLLSNTTFNALRLRDQRMGTAITELQLKYILCVSYANRVIQTAIKHGYGLDIPDVSLLKRAADKIQLPGILTKYIEAIGVLELASGIRVGPYAGDYDRLFPERGAQITPSSILIEANRVVPENHWHIDFQWIEEWNMASTRSQRLGLPFHTVNDVFEARPEMVCSYVSTAELDPDDLDRQCYGVSPQGLSEQEGMLGATYKFRDYENQDQWLPGRNSLLFAGFRTSDFIPRKFFSDLVVASFTSVNI